MSSCGPLKGCSAWLPVALEGHISSASVRPISTAFETFLCRFTHTIEMLRHCAFRQCVVRLQRCPPSPPFSARCRGLALRFEDTCSHTPFLTPPRTRRTPSSACWFSRPLSTAVQIFTPVPCRADLWQRHHGDGSAGRAGGDAVSGLCAGPCRGGGRLPGVVHTLHVPLLQPGLFLPLPLRNVRQKTLQALRLPAPDRVVVGPRRRLPRRRRRVVPCGGARWHLGACFVLLLHSWRLPLWCSRCVVVWLCVWLVGWSVGWLGPCVCSTSRWRPRTALSTGARALKWSFKSRKLAPGRRVSSLGASRRLHLWSLPLGVDVECLPNVVLQRRVIPPRQVCGQGRPGVQV